MKIKNIVHQYCMLYFCNAIFVLRCIYWYISLHVCLWHHNYYDPWGHDLTFKDIDDVGMVQFGHDFDFSSDSVDFCFIVNLQLFDVLNCNLQKKKSRKIKIFKKSELFRERKPLSIFSASLIKQILKRIKLVRGVKIGDFY